MRRAAHENRQLSRDVATAYCVDVCLLHPRALGLPSADSAVRGVDGLASTVVCLEGAVGR